MPSAHHFRWTFRGRRGDSGALIAAFAALLLIGPGVLCAQSRFETPIAITGLTVVPEPGRTIESATVLISNGRIVAVGTEVEIPPQAQQIDGTGLWAYAGFIDATAHLGINDSAPDEQEMARLLDEEQEVDQGPRTAMQKANRNGVWPHRGVGDLWVEDDEESAGFRKVGFAAALISPHPAILGGTGSVVQLSGGPLRTSIVGSDLTQIVSTRPVRRPGARSYPTSSMGAVALLRQTYLDADWYRRRQLLFEEHSQELERVEVDVVLEGMRPLLEHRQTWIFLANTASEIHHALDLAEELDQRVAILGGTEAWRVVGRLQAAAVPVIVSPSWDEEPAIEVRPKPTQAGNRPLTRTWSRAWEERSFEPQSAREERHREWLEQVGNLRALADAGVRVAITGRDAKSPQELWKKLQTAVEHGLTGDQILAALTTGPASILAVDDQLGTIATGKVANLTLMTGPLDDEKSRVRAVYIDGKRFLLAVADSSDSDDEDSDDEKEKKESRKEKRARQREAESAEEGPSWTISVATDRARPIDTGGNVLLRNARVITMAGPILEATDVRIVDGRIAAIGQDLDSAGAIALDLDGYWVMPGIIDAHSHLAVTSINEGSQSITSEVRQADVVNHRQLGIQRALAGGVTTIHTMHGSANAMGGQNAVLKLKYDTSPRQMLVTDGPRIVKFALGENVTRSRTPPRYPNTRMGVESVMRQGFSAALEYQAEWKRYKEAVAAGKLSELPRKDLRLEALSDILRGDLWVHAHSYRADEILRLLAVAEDYGFRIATMQHVLEGYRVAPEMYNHGVGGSTFSDWWGYKIEAFDAIPYNAAMMLRAGIVTSINSDSGEVIRHLNLEASKMIRFGGLEAEEALRLITIHPATQIGLSDRIGSIEIGKDGDLAVFRGHPLDTHALNVMTLVEGEIYFAHPDLDLEALQSSEAPAPESPNGEWVPAPPRAPFAIAIAASGAYAIRGGEIHTISGEVIADGVIVLRDGKIEALGRSIEVPPEAVVVDATGLRVYPGLIDAASQLGVVEISGIEQTRDYAEIARFQPDVRTASAVNPFNTHIRVTRAEGITTAAVVPVGGFIAGRIGLIQLDGWSMPQMMREGDIGLVVDLPSLPPNLTGETRSDRLDDHEKQVAEIETYFDRARHYAEVQSLVGTRVPGDLRLDAMVPYMRAEKRVFFRANSYKEILEAVGFAEAYGLEAVILGGGEAWKCAELLAEKGISVVVTSVFNTPNQRFERYDAYYANPGRLEKAGVDFCIAREARGGSGGAKLLPLHAGMAVAHGLSPERAIRAITLDAAKILGVEEAIGSLERGKIADVILTTGDPTQASTRTVAVFIAGVPVELTSQHEEHYEKFSNRPPPDLSPTGELRGPPAMRVR